MAVSEENGGYTIVPNSLIDDTTLSGTEKLVLLSLIRYRNKEQGRAWASVHTIAKCADVSDFWVRETLKQLEAKGYIRSEKRAGHTTLYEVLTPQLSCPRNSVAPATELLPPSNSVATHPATQLPPPRNSVATTITNTNTNLQVRNTNTNTPSKIDDEFEAFWKEYPKPKNPDKSPGRKKYEALRKKGVSSKELLTAAKNYAIAMRGNDPRYIKHCATFLGPSDAWRDYLATPDAPNNPENHYKVMRFEELFPETAQRKSSSNLITL